MSDTYITHPINPAVSVGNYELVTNIKYQPYPTSSLGVIIVDENLDLSMSRKFISLYTMKSSWSKFQDIVDTQVTELLPNEPRPPLPYMVSSRNLAKAIEAEHTAAEISTAIPIMSMMVS